VSQVPIHRLSFNNHFQREPWLTVPPRILSSISYRRQEAQVFTGQMPFLSTNNSITA